ncbi:MAG TPA: hypothetical protein VKN18_26295 [Blastocatellia bacterium]|nr:hypothetical protein [Blastocatellia bacterium]
MRRRRKSRPKHVIILRYRLSAFIVLAILLTAFNLTDVGTSSAISTQQRSRYARTRSEAKPAFQSSFGSFEFSRKISSPTDQARPAIEEDVEGRSDWFTFQRSYPSNMVPADARLRAWREIPRYQIDGAFGPQASATWRAIGPSPTFSSFWGLTSGRVNAIAISPAKSTLVLIGTSTGGVWRSTDSGETFVPVSDDQVDLAVGSIAFSKSNPTIAYAGMGDTKGGYLGSGVLKSTDEGRTWIRVSNNSLPSPGSISTLEIDPANSNRVYVAQYSKVAGGKVTSSGVYVSSDGGLNWQKVLAGAPRDLSIDPVDSRIIYAGLSRLDKDVDPPYGLYRSSDSGANWTNVFTASQYELNKRRDFRVSVSPANPRIIYVYFGGFPGVNLEARFRVSTDAGATWIDRSLAQVDTAQLGYNTYLTAHPTDAQTVYLGSRDLFKSTDGGESWSNLTHNFYDIGFGFQYAPNGAATHPDQHALEFLPGSPNEFYVGNDGGISKTTDNGETFRSLNATLTLTQFVDITLHPTNPSISFGGSQDNGTQRRIDSRWQEVFSGDGGHAVINPLNPDMVFITYIRGEIFRYVNEGQTFDAQVASNETFGEFLETPRIAFYPPFVSNGRDATLYFGTWRLFVSTNLGGSWFAPAGSLDLTKGTNDIGRDVLSAIGVSRSNPNVIYTGSVQGRAMRSANGGQSWTDVTGGLPDRSITSITVDPTDPSVAYLTVSGFNTGHVFRTTNTGASWLDISGSLPDIPANAMLVDPSDSNTIYLGTDIGIFRSTARGDSWRSFNRGLPPVVIHGFSANSNGVIQAATYGRGAFELGGASGPPAINAVTFDGRKSLTIEGSGFGDAPMVLVNGVDRSFRIAETSDVSILLAGKIKKLGLVSGENTIQVVRPDSVSSNIFRITLTL